MGPQEKAYQTQLDAEDDFELRTVALQAAVDSSARHNFLTVDIIRRAKAFEQYIREGA